MRGIIDIDNHPGIRYNNELNGTSSFDYYENYIMRCKPGKHKNTFDVETQNDDDEVFNKYQVESEVLFI